MTLFDIAYFKRDKNTYQVTKERIKREGSRFFNWTVPVIASGASVSIYLPDQFPESRKYQPLDYCQVTNNDTNCDLRLTINGKDVIPIPAGVIGKIRNKALWHITITNDGGVDTTLAKIYCTFQREPLTTDKWIRGQR